MDGAAAPVVITREDAVNQGLDRYFTGERCKQGHIAQRYVENNRCCECVRLKMRRDYLSNHHAGLPRIPERWPNDGGAKRVTVVNETAGRSFRVGWTRCLRTSQFKGQHLFFSEDVARNRICPACKDLEASAYQNWSD